MLPGEYEPGLRRAYAQVRAQKSSSEPIRSGSRHRYNKSATSDQAAFHPRWTRLPGAGPLLLLPPPPIEAARQRTPPPAEGDAGAAGVPGAEEGAGGGGAGE